MFTLYSADCMGNPGNCSYPHATHIANADDLKMAVCHDYVCAEYKDNYRSNDNFVCSDCLAVDCDNDHSEDPDDWKTPEDIKQAFPDVSFAVHYSRHHNRKKNGKTARPKFHVFFQIESMTDADAYAALKQRINGVFPYFDTKALDAAHFFYGTKDPQVGFFPSTITLNECLDRYYPEVDFDKDMDQGGSQTIPEGCRNATMSHFAGKVLKRLGDTSEAYSAFQERAAKCDPPLDDRELAIIWRSAQNFYKRIAAAPGYVPPDEYAAENGYQYKPTDASDLAEARVLAEHYNGILRYSPATDFIYYNGTVWEESIPMAHAVMHGMSDLQLGEAEAAVDAAWTVLQGNGVETILQTSSSKKKAEAALSKEQMKAYLAWVAAVNYKTLAMHYRESKGIGYVLREVPPMVLIRPQDLDADPFMLNTPEATYDLTKGLDGVQPHSADDFITKVTTVNPSNHGMQLWQDAMDVFFQGDQELKDYVQLVAGMLAVGKVFIETMIIAYGDGRNGKSTFWNVIARVLGDYSGNISADALTVGCRRNVKPEMAEAKGKRLLIASELEEGMRLNTSVVKQMCSTDMVWAEKKYKAPFQFTPSHTLVLYTNHLPKVGATDAGIWRRLVVIPFNAKIEGKSDIKNYADYLFENAGEAVLSWIIEGAQRIIRQNFKISPPKCVRDAVAAYREENDWLSHFLNECCEVGTGLEVKSGELYTAYRNFCADTGEYTRSTTDFYSALEAEGYVRQKTRKYTLVKGIALRPSEAEDAESDFLT